MIIRRTLLIIAAILAVIMAGGAALLTGGQLAQTINYLLPAGWKIEIPHALETDWQHATLPEFSLTYQDCPLLKANNLKIQWAEPVGIWLDQGSLDYACVAKLPSSDEPSDFSGESLKSLLALVPDGEIGIEQFSLINLPESTPERVKSLLNTPTAIHFAKKGEDLTPCIRQPQFHFCAELKAFDFKGNAKYQPSEDEQHLIDFSGKLSEALTALPPQLQLDYRWQFPKKIITDPKLQQGQSRLEWQADEKNELVGSWQVQSTQSPEDKFTLPFRFDQQSLSVEQGRIDWQLSPQFHLRGFLTSKITPNSFDPNQLFPIKTALRLSLQTENSKGKGNIVLNSPNGEWLADRFQLPFQINGNIKQGNFILYSAVPLEIGGDYADPALRFLPSALLRLTGKERFLEIDDLRFPLAGIRMDRRGINGRLHAIFRGKSPDFKAIELHLDGFANNFKAGLLKVFDDPTDKNAIKDRWQWRFWGNSTLSAIPNKLQIAGRGDWQQNIVQLTEFKGELDQIKRNGVRIPKLELSLLEPLILAYEKWHLTGGVKLSMPQIQFDYGGELLNPTAQLQLNGEIENLSMKGEIAAGELGPIRLFARRQLTNKSSDLIGRLYWHEQPAKVFQSLFPFRSQWVITHGTIKGETAFSANAQKGVVAGGHFAVHNGAISLPNGELKGIEFSLPYQFKQNEFDIGVKRALDVKIAEINLGLPLRNAQLKVQGHYPYSRKRPLFLRQLSVELLGGSLFVDDFALPQRQIAYLNLRDIHFEQILALAQYHQLDLKGKFDAILPFWLNGKPCYICNGNFAQSQGSYLKFTPELLNAMKKSGYTEQILTYLVNDSHIDHLHGSIDVAKNGEMKLRSSVQMHLAEHENAKINLNYNHQENLFDLWKLINYGSQFEQQIEHNLYQQLDKR